jgi:adenylate cyclase class IV
VLNDKQRFFFEVDNVENLDTFYEYEFGISDINVEGRLKKSVEFWEQIGTSKIQLRRYKRGS